MSYTDLVTLLPAWGWLVVAGACVLTALFLFAWFLPTLQWAWLIADDPYVVPDFPEHAPVDWADWGWVEDEVA